MAPPPFAQNLPSIVQLPPVQNLSLFDLPHVQKLPSLVPPSARDFALTCFAQSPLCRLPKFPIRNFEAVLLRKFAADFPQNFAAARVLRPSAAPEIPPYAPLAVRAQEVEPTAVRVRDFERAEFRDFS